MHYMDKSISKYQYHNCISKTKSGVKTDALLRGDA